jgi:hypothetical protein
MPKTEKVKANIGCMSTEQLESIIDALPEEENIFRSERGRGFDFWITIQTLEEKTHIGMLSVTIWPW